MVEPVAMLLNGRGHRTVRAHQAGLATAEDADVAEYCLTNNLVVVTFDLDFRKAMLRAGCRCLCIRGRELTARERLADGYSRVIELFETGVHLVTLPTTGDAFEGKTPAKLAKRSRRRRRRGR